MKYIIWEGKRSKENLKEDTKFAKWLVRSRAILDEAGSIRRHK
jgi:hypothetical protein